MDFIERTVTIDQEEMLRNFEKEIQLLMTEKQKEEDKQSAMWVVPLYFNNYPIPFVGKFI